jgi:hypothetical protein
LDSIRLGNAPCANQLRSCAYNAFVGNVGIMDFECFTNDCLCRPDMFSSAISVVSTDALARCSNDLGDMSSATSCMISYCVENGYSTAGTSVISLTAAVSTTPAGVATATGMSVTTFLHSG